MLEGVAGIGNNNTITYTLTPLPLYRRLALRYPKLITTAY